MGHCFRKNEAIFGLTKKAESIAGILSTFNRSGHPVNALKSIPFMADVCKIIAIYENLLPCPRKIES